MGGLETRRKAFHLLTGLAIAALVHAGYAGGRLLLLSAALLVPLGLLARRVRVPLFSPLLSRLERPENMRTLPAKGTVLFLAGSAAALALFPRPAALAGILVLSVGDAVSCEFGRRYGKIRHPFHPRKMVEGHLAGTLAAGLACLAVVPPLPAFASAAAAMFVEGFDLRAGGRSLDDNLTLPIVAAAVADLLLR